MPPQIQQGVEQRLPDLVRGVEWWSPLPNERRRTRWGTRSRVLIYKSFLWFAVFSYLIKFYFLDGFADKRATEPNFSLVNKESLDKILCAKVFVLDDGQLRAAHIILGYIADLIRLLGTEVRDQSQRPPSSPHQCSCPQLSPSWGCPRSRRHLLNPNRPGKWSSHSIDPGGYS